MFPCLKERFYLWGRTFLAGRKDSFIRGNATCQSEFGQDNGMTRKSTGSCCKIETGPQIFCRGPVIFTVPARSTLKLHFNPLAEVITLLNDDVLYTDAVCNLPPEIGPCDAYFPRYYYNSTTRSCEPFIYGGCSGNDNRFTTVAECEAQCAQRRESIALNGRVQ